MAEKLIVSISGLRGIIGENLTANIAADYGCAFGSFLKSKNPKPVLSNVEGEKLSVCIGTDSRPSRQMVTSAVAAGLCSVGINVVELGIVTTPGVGIMLRELKCDGGIVITASHNPIQYNGIKLLLSNGIAPPPKQAEEIKKLFHDKNFQFVNSKDCGKITTNEQADETHIEKVLAIIDKEKISSKNFKVALDSVNGAGSRVTLKILAELGCQTTAINAEQTGLFAHEPEPIAKNLTGLCETVKEKKAQIGFAQDPDADRLAIVDENGNYIGEEYTLALAAKYILSKKSGKAAANLSTSRMLDDIALQNNSEVIRTAVGEANVADAMVKNNCIIGGEGNGGVIDLRVGPIRDSLVGIVLVLQLMAETGKSVSELVGEIGKYAMKKDKFPADKKTAEKIMQEAKKVFANAKIDTSDGFRFDFDDSSSTDALSKSWFNLRISNTEPVMRLIIEAKDEKTVEKYTKAVSEIRKKIAE